MYDYERELAQQHIADLHRDAEQRRLALLAHCCSEVVRFFSALKARVAGKPVR